MTERKCNKELYTARAELRENLKEMQKLKADLAVYMEERQAMEQDLLQVQQERDQLRHDITTGIDSLRTERETNVKLSKQLKMSETQITAMSVELEESRAELLALKSATRPLLKSLQAFERALLDGDVDLTV